MLSGLARSIRKAGRRDHGREMEMQLKTAWIATALSMVLCAPVLAAEVAADVASLLARDRGADLGAHLKARYPPERAGRFVFVAVPGGPMFSSTSQEVPESIRLTAMSAFGERPLAFSDAVRPITTARLPDCTVRSSRRGSACSSVLRVRW